MRSGVFRRRPGVAPAKAELSAGKGIFASLVVQLKGVAPARAELSAGKGIVEPYAVAVLAVTVKGGRSFAARPPAERTPPPAPAREPATTACDPI